MIRGSKGTPVRTLKISYKTTNQLSCRKCPEKLQLYQADRAMPVRGLLATKLRFGIKLAALNFKKLSAYLDSLDQCALLSANS